MAFHSPAMWRSCLISVSFICLFQNIIDFITMPWNILEVKDMAAYEENKNFFPQGASILMAQYHWMLNEDNHFSLLENSWDLIKLALT